MRYEQKEVEALNILNVSPKRLFSEIGITSACSLFILQRIPLYIVSRHNAGAPRSFFRSGVSALSRNTWNSVQSAEQSIRRWAKSRVQRRRGLSDCRHLRESLALINGRNILLPFSAILLSFATTPIYGDQSKYDTKRRGTTQRDDFPSTLLNFTCRDSPELLGRDEEASGRNSGTPANQAKPDEREAEDGISGPISDAIMSPSLLERARADERDEEETERKGEDEKDRLVDDVEGGTHRLFPRR
ncbi:hypothetical protein HZH66_009093 [Vespula vulgaris]|uniref:Uncharacterized protein n=1 Tax=Vespula vulgaris TaxID=7454 RepID=A0A834N2D0_VESVU|nr:hypothetical protein HZH66_009093 [Vespula vulgaris]